MGSTIWTFEHIVFSDCESFTFWIKKNGEEIFEITDVWNTRSFEKSEAIAILVCESLNQNNKKTH